MKNSGIICLNGAAACLVQPGDTVIIIAYSPLMTVEEAKQFEPIVVMVNDKNCVTAIQKKELPGTIA